jgi:hypothetical protein
MYRDVRRVICSVLVELAKSKPLRAVILLDTTSYVVQLCHTIKQSVGYENLQAIENVYYLLATIDQVLNTSARLEPMEQGLRFYEIITC